MLSIKEESPEKNPKPKNRRWLLVSLLILLFLGAAGLWYWNTNKEQIIAKKIESSVREKSDSLYSFKYDSLYFRELEGSFSIRNMHVYADSMDLARTISKKGMPSLLMDVKIPLLSIRGLKTPKAFFNNKLVARKLEITNPHIEIRHAGKKAKKDQTIPMAELREILLADLNLIDVDTILIKGGQIRIEDKASGKTSFEIGGVDALFSNVWIDSLAAEDTNRLLFSRAFSVSAAKFSWLSTENRYLLNLNDLLINSERKEITVGRFSVLPQKSETAFMKSLSVQDDRVDFWSTKIQFAGVDMRKLFEDKLIADQVSIAQASCKIYRDLRLPKNTQKRVFYIQKKRKEGELMFNIRRVSISNSLVEYKELNDLTGKVWKMGFHDVGMTINNFTNAGNRNEVTTAESKARFLDKVPIVINWKFYLNDPAGRFTIKGESGGLENGKLLNQVVEPTSMAVIRQGSLQKLSCELNGNDHTVGGTVNILYKGLKIDVMELDAGAAKPDKKFISSLFLNVKTKNDNPRADNPPRIAKVTVSRDPTHSIFNACWKSIFRGISDITGIPM